MENSRGKSMGIQWKCPKMAPKNFASWHLEGIQQKSTAHSVSLIFCQEMQMQIQMPNSIILVLSGAPSGP